MSIVQLSEYYKHLSCPRCRCPLSVVDGVFSCTSSDCPCSAAPFPVINAAPALVDFERSIISAGEFLATGGSPQVERTRTPSAVRRLVSKLDHSTNYQAKANVSRMLGLLRRSAEGTGRPVVLVIGGGSLGAGLEELYEAPDIDVLAFDIYWSPLTQFIADGHGIPLGDESIDGVIVQAVLEHVLEPNVVVSEIHRVLRPAGLVYADTPFLQQVHEGAYDFTRFTDSGHRYLLRDFERIDSGTVAGPATELMWSIDHFVRALARSRHAGRIAKLAFFWLRYVDRFLDQSYSIDSASSVYFFGRKASRRMTAQEIVAYYQGAQ